MAEIIKAGSRPTRRGPKESFSGTVWQDPIITPQAPMRVVASRVAFEPGARTAWHTHPLGQTLYVIQDFRLYQGRNEQGMVHIATQESLDGNHITWMEHVTDAEYNANVG